MPILFGNSPCSCSEDGVAGNGALMRLAPVPLFFHRNPHYAVEFSGVSGVITHGDRNAYDTCRYYGALIVAVLHGESKDDLLNNDFYLKHESWFSGRSLTQEVMDVVRGSYKRRGGYDEGIRGKGYIVNAMEAALWAFWSDKGSFEQGALNAVNLGDETGTTAAIYGQLAGAYYGYEHLPRKWAKHVYGHPFITCLSKWIVYEGESWQPTFQVLHTPGSDLRRHSSFYRDVSSWPSNQSTTVVPTSISSRRLSVTKLLGMEGGRSLEPSPAYGTIPEASSHTHRRLSVAAAPSNISGGTGHFYGGARASYGDDPDPTYNTRHRTQSLVYYEKPH